jgi:hypothetical protein
MCELILSHTHCYQLKVFSRLVIKFIMRCVATNVRGKLFIDATGRVLYSAWSISPHYWLFYYQSKYLCTGI